jgi:tetratricopeptide (TPR) repeat protein
MRNRLERNHVTAKPEAAGTDPTPEEVRAALERLTASEGFRSSPQLAAFLGFTVEAVLRGERERIKAYTIAVEALGRDERFDPQADPIVRVEATRLRRAVERYYAGPGADDPVVIELRPGSYVPAFRRRAAPAPPGPALVGLRARAPPILRPLHLLALVGAGLAVGLTVLAVWRAAPEPGRGLDDARRGAAPAGALAPGNGMPTLLVEGLGVAGATGADSLLSANLLANIRDAFARFDAVNIASPPAAPATPNAASAAASSVSEPRLDYRLAGSMELHPDRTATVGFRLLDSADNTVIWSKSFDRLATAPDWSLAEDAIVRDMAATLLQPFGVIHSHDRAKQLATGAGDPRYRCVLDASDSLRSFDTEQHVRSRDCLEQLTAIDSGFATGLRYLAAIYLREHLFGGGADDAAALGRAFDAVHRAIQLQPESSRGYHTLSSILFSRGDVAPAFAADDRAIALNKYDLAVLSDYGGRLVSTGQIERGMAMLGAVEPGVLRQSSHQFYLFLGHYLQGDLPAAAQNASQIVGDAYPLGLLARALAAAANGERDKALDALARLVAVRPAWRYDTRGELRKFFPEPAILERLARDLAAAGLSG